MRDFIQVITTLSKLFQDNKLLIVDIMLELVEMQSNPGISITSLTKEKVYNDVDLSGEVAPEFKKTSH